MLLPPASGYYVTNRVDVPPPPPPQHGPPIPHSPAMAHSATPPAGPILYEEWHESPPPGFSNGKGSKILNRPNNKDKFKPSPSYVSKIWRKCIYYWRSWHQQEIIIQLFSQRSTFSSAAKSTAEPAVSVATAPALLLQSLLSVPPNGFPA